MSRCEYNHNEFVSLYPLGFSNITGCTVAQRPPDTFFQDLISGRNHNDPNVGTSEWLITCEEIRYDDLVST
ncbi:hypothetical protein M378DRAFT_159717 [Amanita muscaria Koide BX008]|uniref:Uncharacterized protein n=1 Tax=Amanita muscaria (strain Koide BX008) TaxID=946122 RepID=A0A0C2RWK7_AMAMK|nr:hypothetical protein M378DRAFT_174122 [Amanita muscaria Koide BX008]KIL67308.1 hypothetical protein M378DRAFT_159717 [Amanita muscaria Koide BX008]